MSRGKKCHMPILNVFDKPKENRFFLQWSIPGSTQKTTKSCTYGKKYTKEEAYKQMLDMRYEIMEKWMEEAWGLKTQGTQTESV